MQHRWKVLFLVLPPCVHNEIRVNKKLVILKAQRSSLTLTDKMWASSYEQINIK